MTLRETLSTLAITTVVVLLVVVAGLLFKDSRREVVSAIPVSVAEVADDPVGRPREPTADFETLEGAAYVDSRANEADTLRIRHGGEEHLFVLYFVDALETSLGHPARVEEQRRYFGLADAQTVTAYGREAADHVAELLKQRPFRVLTRWERVEGTLRYYALIQVQGEDGRPENLAERLLRLGYARVGGMDTFLPNDPRDVPTYGTELLALARQARTQKTGVWAQSVGR
jgi:endonuclease YncB( thermonuclease family)